MDIRIASCPRAAVTRPRKKSATPAHEPRFAGEMPTIPPLPFRRSRFKVGCSMFKVRCWMFDVRPASPLRSGERAGLRCHFGLRPSSASSLSALGRGGSSHSAFRIPHLNHFVRPALVCEAKSGERLGGLFPGRRTAFFSGWFSPANPGVPYIASYIRRGRSLINTPLQRGEGDGLGVGTASPVYPPP